MKKEKIVGVLNKVAVIAATGVILLSTSLPASAATTGWLGGSLQYVNVGGCAIGASVGTNTVTAAETYPCTGSVGAQAQWTPNGVTYYTTSWKYDAEVATTGQATCQLIRVYHA